LGIWAEHGHQYDIINNTFNEDETPIEYSLGDKIVVEIVDKFFDEVRKKQGELGIDPAIINDLDNVRPQSAIVNWLDYIDEQGKLKQLYYETITSFIVNNAGQVATLVWDFIRGEYRPDLLKAARELAKKGAAKYVVFGHTHDPLDKALPKDARYLNTGTWRKFIEPKGRPSTRMRTVPTSNEGGAQLYTQEPYFYYKFKSTINLSYVLFYEKGEGKVGPRLVQQKREAE
jgi:UDP-2,3-diacylglucosamine pyrophosphatase LpxH